MLMTVSYEGSGSSWNPSEMLPSGKELEGFGDQCKTYFNPSTGGWGGREVGHTDAIARIIQIPVHTRGRKKCTKVGRGIGDSGEVVFGSGRGFEGLEVSCSWDQLGGGVIDDPEGAPGEGGLDAGE